MALVLTKESIELGPNIAGSIGLRSKFTRRGIDLLSGPQIDPGFKGPLHLTLINLSPSSVNLSEGDRFCTIEFHKLPEPVERMYEGTFQEQYKITTEEIRDIKEEEYTLSEIYKSMRRIATDVNSMKKSYQGLSERINLHMRIFVGTIVALVVAVISRILL